MVSAAIARPSRRDWAVLVAVAGALAGIDLTTKAWALQHAQRWPPLQPLPGVELSVTLNHGSAFGLARDWPGAPIGLSVLTLGVCGGLLALAWRVVGARPRLAIAIGLALGGALANLVDRLALEVPVWGQVPQPAVVDFIVLRASPRLAWPAFNVADVGIAVGLVWLGATLLRRAPVPAAPPPRSIDASGPL